MTTTKRLAPIAALLLKRRNNMFFRAETTEGTIIIFNTHTICTMTPHKNDTTTIHVIPDNYFRIHTASITPIDDKNPVVLYQTLFDA